MGSTQFCRQALFRRQAARHLDQVDAVILCTLWRALILWPACNRLFFGMNAQLTPSVDRTSTTFDHKVTQGTCSIPRVYFWAWWDRVQQHMTRFPLTGLSQGVMAIMDSLRTNINHRTSNHASSSNRDSQHSVTGDVVRHRITSSTPCVDVSVVSVSHD